MKLTKVKTEELTGAALDWSVAVATRGYDKMPSVPQWMLWDDYHPTKSWLLCGPLLAELMASSQYAITPFLDGGFAISNTDNEGFPYNGDMKQGCFEVIGDDLLIVTCRAVVGSKLGEEVDVPAELVGGAA